MALTHFHVAHRPGVKGSLLVRHIIETKTALLTPYTTALCGDKPALSTSGWQKSTDEPTCEPCLRRKRMIERKRNK